MTENFHVYMKFSTLLARITIHCMWLIFKLVNADSYPPKYLNQEIIEPKKSP